MTCLTSNELAALEAGTLEPQEEDRARGHLRDCESCFARKDELVGTARLLGALEAAEISPSTASWDAIEARIAGRTPAATAVSIACAYCKGKLARKGAVYCAACIAPHHEDCWEDHGRCAACGAGQFVKAAISVRPARRRRAWAMAAAGVLVGAGGVAALQWRPAHELAKPQPAPQYSASSGGNWLVDLALEKPARKSYAELASELQKGPGSMSVDDLRALVREGTASVSTGSPAADIDVLAHAALELVGRQGGRDTDTDAIAGYKRVIAIAPSNVEGHLARARLARRGLDGKAELEKSLQEYALAVTLAPDSIPFEIERAELLPPDVARAELTKVIERSKSPKDLARLLAARAQVALRAADAAAVLADLNAAVNHDPDDSSLHLELGRELFSRSRLEEARLELRRAAQIDPRSASIWSLLGRIDELDFDYEGALGSYARAIELNPDLGEPWLGRGRILVLMSDPSEISDEVELAKPAATLGDLVAEVGATRAKRLREARAALGRLDRAHGARMERARLALATGERETAIGELENAARSTSEPVEIGGIEALRGLADLPLPDPASARSHFESALGDAKDLALAVAGLATVYRKQGDEAQARSLFRKARAAAAASSDPEEARFFARGVDLARRARLTQDARTRVLARRAFTRVLARNPLSAVGYLERAELARDFQRWDAAVDDAQAAIRADPCFFEAYELLLLLFAHDLPREADAATQRPAHLHGWNAVSSDAYYKAPTDTAEERSAIDAIARLGNLQDHVPADIAGSAKALTRDFGSGVDDLSNPIAPILRGLRLVHASRVQEMAAIDARVIFAVAKLLEAAKQHHERKDELAALERLDRAIAVASELAWGSPNVAQAEALRNDAVELQAACRKALAGK